MATYGLPINLYSSTLTTAVTANGTSFVVTSAGSLIANTYLVIEPLSATNKEIVYITVVAGTTLTVTRGVGGTSGVDHAAGSLVIQTLTAEILADLKMNLEAYEDTVKATKPLLVTAGTNGLAAANKGTATTAARSDHTHAVYISATTRATTGSQVITSVGFTPKMIFVIASVASSTAPGCYGMSYGLATSSSNQSVHTVYSYDTGAEHQVESTTASAQIVKVSEEDGTAGCEAAISAVGSDGFTLNWTTANHTCAFQYLCFG